MQKNNDWLNVVVQKNSDDEGSGSNSDKSSGSESDKSESEEEEDDEDDEDSGYFPGSKLIKSGGWQKSVHKWTKQKKKWKLIFRASKESFSATKFHQKCDNKGPTITIIESTNGNVFGGYNELDWSTNSQYGNTNNNFLFILSNKKK